jgi:hypothetical protein
MDFFRSLFSRAVKLWKISAASAGAMITVTHE